MRVVVELYPVERKARCSTPECKSDGPVYEVLTDYGERARGGFSFLACREHFAKWQADVAALTVE
jgi:hypothetical protein